MRGGGWKTGGNSGRMRVGEREEIAERCKKERKEVRVGKRE
jgi:hypothetical protein